MPSTQEGDAGYDLYPCFSQEYIIINPQETTLIPTGIALEVPVEHVAIIFERGSVGSIGLGRRAGVVDSGYRGEVFVGITNTSEKPIAISKDPISTMNQHQNIDKVLEYDHAIAQFVLLKYESPELLETDELTYTERGDQALGHTDK